MNSGIDGIFPAPQILPAIRKNVRRNQNIYLVGGSVRDALLGRPIHDLDFTADGDVCGLARAVAADLNGAYYLMDAERQTARIVLRSDGGERLILDFALIRGSAIGDDLAARDFTVNAMAFDLAESEKIIDPLNGALDLRYKRLRACSATSFSDDPVRVLRAIRQSLGFGFQIEAQTIQWMKAAVHQLPLVSSERQRDEFFRILDLSEAPTALRVMDNLKILELLFPELSALKGVSQSPPHTLDVFEHTLAVIQMLDGLYDLFLENYSEEKGSNLIFGLAQMMLGRYRDVFRAHFDEQLNPNRSRRALLRMAALYHDTGKPAALSRDSQGKIRFFKHETTSSALVEARARLMALSNAETDYLKTTVENHMRLHHLASAGSDVSRRSIYRYYRDLGDAGVDLCFLSLADLLATYGVTITVDIWERELSICRQILDAWFEKRAVVVAPPRLVDGDQLMEILNSGPGKHIGEILEIIREAQASGQITTYDQAAVLAKAVYNRQQDNERFENGN